MNVVEHFQPELTCSFVSQQLDLRFHTLIESEVTVTATLLSELDLFSHLFMEPFRL